MSNYLENLKDELGEFFDEDDIPIYLIACEINLLTQSIEEVLGGINSFLKEISDNLPKKKR